MTTINKIWSMVMLVSLISTSVLMVSCGPDDEDIKDDSEVVFPNGGGQSDNNSTKIEVGKYVNSISDYKDYQIVISFNSSLEKVYPGKRIDYLLSFGYNGEYSWIQRCSNYNGQSGTINASVFFNSNGYDYSREAMYVKSYLKLKEKKDSGKSLYEDELSLWNDLLKALNAAEPKAKRMYNARFCAEVDGERYTIKEYTF